MIGEYSTANGEVSSDVQVYARFKAFSVETGPRLQPSVVSGFGGFNREL